MVYQLNLYIYQQKFCISILDKWGVRIPVVKTSNPISVEMSNLVVKYSLDFCLDYLIVFKTSLGGYELINKMWTTYKTLYIAPFNFQVRIGTYFPRDMQNYRKYIEDYTYNLNLIEKL